MGVICRMRASAKLFPDLWFAAYSTHSNNGRYRIFIPTAGSMTVEADGIMKMMIMNVIRDAGYQDKGTRVHGFDLGKLVASSLFYIPCRAPGDASAFFREYPGEELDPMVWLDNAHLHQPGGPASPGVIPTVNGTISRCRGDNERIVKAKAEYLAVSIGGKLRHHAFFLLGVRLRALGCDYSDITQHLASVAQDAKRQRQIASVLASLRKSNGAQSHRSAPLPPSPT